MKIRTKTGKRFIDTIGQSTLTKDIVINFKSDIINFFCDSNEITIETQDGKVLIFAYPMPNITMKYSNQLLLSNI